MRFFRRLILPEFLLIVLFVVAVNLYPVVWRAVWNPCTHSIQLTGLCWSKELP